jgi:hypothetical protein
MGSVIKGTDLVIQEMESVIKYVDGFNHPTGEFSQPMDVCSHLLGVYRNPVHRLNHQIE